MNKYEIIIYWNFVDKVFVAEIPELIGCIAHGDTQDEALKEVNIVAAEWIRVAVEKGWQVPQPKGKLIYA
jgi:predicted RNase H-like HicB family nuclease